MDGPDPPRQARPFIIVFLAALVVCAVVPLNLWPFSNWELFSHLRSDRDTGWLAVEIDRSGRGRVVSPAALPHGHASVDVFMAGFAARPTAARDATCETWLRAAKGARLIDVYRLTWLLSDRSGDRAAPPRRTLDWICSDKGARVDR